MSVTVPSVPRSVDRTTVPPLVVRLFPLASLSCTVMVEVELPSAAMLVGFAVMVEVAKEAVGSTGMWLLITPFDEELAVEPMLKLKSK